MKIIERQWLESTPWEAVVSTNHSLCEAQKLTSSSAKSYETARQLWEKSVRRSMSLREVLELFRGCYELAPFTFNNGNTFASFAKILVEDWANTLPAVEAQIVRTTVSHYTAGHVGKKELAQVLEHFEPSWNNFHIAKPSSTPTPHVFQEPLQVQPGA